MPKILLSFAMVIALVGIGITIIGTAIGELSLLQAFVTTTAFAVIGWSAATFIGE